MSASSGSGSLVGAAASAPTAGGGDVGAVPSAAAAVNPAAPAPSAAAASALSAGGLRVSITAARFVSTWRWDVTGDAEDVCGICRAPFEVACPSCALPGDECPPLVGECRHAYHLHCVTTWLAAKEEQVCPLCRRPWAS